jgi:hypothetical protein
MTYILVLHNLSNLRDGINSVYSDLSLLRSTPGPGRCTLERLRITCETTSPHSQSPARSLLDGIWKVVEKGVYRRVCKVVVPNNLEKVT